MSISRQLRSSEKGEAGECADNQSYTVFKLWGRTDSFEYSDAAYPQAAAYTG